MARWCPTCAAEREGKFCLECGTELIDQQSACACGCSLPAGAKFCPECGRKVEPAAKQIQQEPQCDPLLCPHCHTLQDDKNWRFCMVCGAKREIPEPVPSTSEPVVTASEAAAVSPKEPTPEEWFEKGKEFELGHNQNKIMTKLYVATKMQLKMDLLTLYFDYPLF